MPSTDPAILRAKADRRNLRRKTQRAALNDAPGHLSHKRLSAVKDKYEFRQSKNRWFAPIDLDNPIMHGGPDLIADLTNILLNILPLHTLDDAGSRPEWIEWPTWFNTRFNSPMMYSLFADPAHFEPTLDGFAIRRDHNPHPDDEPDLVAGNFRQRLYTFQDNYGETFVGSVTSASPGLWSMPRAYWESWGMVAEDYNAFGFLDTLNREHLEFGRTWRIRERGPWWLANVPNAFGAWETWSSHHAAPAVADFKQQDDPVREANNLWKNWVYLVADYAIPLHRSRIIEATERTVSSLASTRKRRSKDDHSYSPGGPTVSQLIAATVEWIGRVRPPNSYRPPSNTFPVADI